MRCVRVHWYVVNVVFVFPSGDFEGRFTAALRDHQGTDNKIIKRTQVRHRRG